MSLMPVITINKFGGLSPIINRRKLPDSGATIADMTRLDGADLRTFNVPLVVPPDPTQPSNLFVNGTNWIGKIYRYITADGATKRWLAWLALGQWGRIDVQPSPIQNDQFGRLYQTTAPSSNGTAVPPRVYSNPVISDTLPVKTGGRPLGIPAPTNKPTITPKNDIALATGVPISISNAAPAIVTFSVKHPFKQGQQVLIQLPNSSATNQTGMFEISGKEFLVDIPAGDTQGTTIALRGSDSTHYSTYTHGPTDSVSAVFDDSDYESRAYVWTLVSDWGEEGPPSPPSDVANVLLVNSVGTAGVALNWNRPTGQDGINRARLYRTESGTAGAQFYFVKEFNVTGGSNGSAATITEQTGGGTTLTDAVPAISLGELLPSTTWTAPPTTLFGLVSMPNGFFLGFTGNTIYASEAYEPHAWPFAYTKTVDYNIVGGASYGSSAVVCTQRQPYRVYGSDPASITVSKVDVNAPCISADSICSVGTGVAYATYEGLVVINDNESKIVTQDIVSRADWLAYWDSSMSAVFHENTYFAFSQNPAKPSIALRFEDGRLQMFTVGTIVGRSAVKDPLDDSLYFVSKLNSDWCQISKWDGGALPQAYTWYSKVFTTSHPVTMSALQVFATAYPVTVEVLATTDSTGNPDIMQSVGVFSVQNSQPMRLPAGFRAREWQVHVGGTNAVQTIRMATTMGELHSA
jgi:hypothetical protein